MKVQETDAINVCQNTKKIYAMPPIGKYTDTFHKLLENFGCEMYNEKKLTQKMGIEGCKHSADMICYPFKVTLGYYIDALDNGANVLLAFDSCGTCRLKHYYKMQEYILKKLGYKNFSMISINIKSIFSSFKKINPKLNRIKIIKELYFFWQELKKIDKVIFFDETKHNIGLIGEIYTAIEGSLNQNIEDKIIEVGMSYYNPVTITHFLKSYLKFSNKYEKKAKLYFNGKLGGHGIQNIASVIKMIDHSFDGIIWFRPLTCMPETTVEPVIKSLCNENDMPLLIIDVDETAAEANINTRIETFFELIQLRNKENKGE